MILFVFNKYVLNDNDIPGFMLITVFNGQNGLCLYETEYGRIHEEN